MEEQHSWVEDNLQEPMGPGIDKLPDTYPWRRFLRGVNKTVLFQALLPPMRGAIFTGPTGNGRHTQANALAYSLIGQNVDTPGDLEHACFIQIEPSVISPALEESVLSERVDELYSMAGMLLNNGAEAIAILFDQIDLYPQIFMDRIAAHLVYNSDKRLITICVGRSESKISRNLKSQLPHCRCLMPTAENRKVFLSQIELIEVEDNWTDQLNPVKKSIAVEFEEITMEEIVEKTEGCSYADLQDLLWLIKLGMSNCDMEELKQTDNIVIHVLREDVLEAIRLCKSAAGQEQAAQMVTLQQPIPMGYPTTGDSTHQNTPAKGKGDEEELSVEAKIDLIERSYGVVTV